MPTYAALVPENVVNGRVSAIVSSESDFVADYPRVFTNAADAFVETALHHRPSLELAISSLDDAA